jgi:hypothetical protein
LSDPLVALVARGVKARLKRRGQAREPNLTSLSPIERTMNGEEECLKIFIDKEENC